VYGGVDGNLVLWVVFFFFSSRRRHTRSLRDWSSDVCSSDLTRIDAGEGYTCGITTAGDAYCWGASNDGALGNSTAPTTPNPVLRSEERRVGKECRSRRSAKHEKKKSSACTERERRNAQMYRH